MPRFLR